MGLDEAKAQYKRALSSLLYSCGLGDLNAIEDSVKTLDAAVCDFGLAAAREARDTGLPHTEAKIKRLLGSRP